MISAVVVYNNEDIEESLIVRSLRRQSACHELLLIDNIGNKSFTSASAALNHGAKKTGGDYIMFVHQDVDLLNDDFLEKAEESLSKLCDLGIAGVAGISELGKTHRDRRRNLIYHGVPRKKWGKKIEEAECIHTLDECLLIVPRKVFERLPFDEETCDNWHLYGVDYCLSLAALGLKAYVLPLSIYHKSIGESARPHHRFVGGSLSADYVKSFEAVRKKHKRNIPVIHTSCGSFLTKWPVNVQRIFRWLHRLRKRNGW